MTVPSVMSEHRHGYYDDKGRWHRSKLCSRDCGDRCTCQPPLGLYYSEYYDKSSPKYRAEYPK